MAKVLPITALRPSKAHVAKVAAPPYDVLNSAEAAARIALEPLSLLGVTKAEARLPGSDPYAPEVYQAAAERLQQLQDQGVLVRDEAPAYYIYRLTMDGREQTGIAAAYSVVEYCNNHIKKHEFTRPDKENDRTTHIRITKAQTGPAFLAFRSNDAMNALLKELVANQPEYDFVADDGVQHTLWHVSSSADIERVRMAFESIPELYIADGHHRSASAARLASEQPDNVEAQTFVAVAFPHRQLKIMDYNRVVRDLHGLSDADLLDALDDKFFIEVVGNYEVKPTKRHQFGMYLDGNWYKLKAKSHLVDEKDCQARLDVNILQRNILQPLLGIDDPRTDKRIDFVGGIRGMKELVRLVDSGEYAVAFALFPPTMDDLLDIADAGQVMPPKSTWFEPKLRDGLLIKTI